MQEQHTKNIVCIYFIYSKDDRIS